MVRHGPLRPFDFLNDLAGIGRDLLVRIENEVGGADERFGEVHGIVDHDDPRQIVAVTHQVFGDARTVAAGNAIPANPSHLEMSGRDGQHIAFPPAGREPLPRMRRVLGWMRTAVHPDRALRRLPRNVRVVGNQLLRRRIDLLPDSEVGRAAGRVVRRMRFALVFRQRENGRVPAVSVQPRRLVDGDSEIVPDLGAGNALRLIFVKTRRPLAGEIEAGGVRHHLCARRHDRRRHRRQRQQDCDGDSLPDLHLASTCGPDCNEFRAVMGDFS